jgi:hypothetical protein
MHHASDSMRAASRHDTGSRVITPYSYMFKQTAAFYLKRSLRAACPAGAAPSAGPASDGW